MLQQLRELQCWDSTDDSLTLNTAWIERSLISDDPKRKVTFETLYLTRRVIIILQILWCIGSTGHSVLRRSPIELYRRNREQRNLENLDPSSTVCNPELVGCIRP